MITGTVAHSGALRAPDFDAEILAHGTPALWRRARMCPCFDPVTGHPAIDCGVCTDGILWDGGQAVRILANNRRREDVYDIAGQRMEGMCMLTFPTGITPGHLDRVELTAAVMTVNNELHVRGELDKAGRSTERLRIAPALSIEFCEAIVAGVVTAYAFFTDFTVDAAGAISWNPGHGPADGSQYTVRYTTRPTYLIWSPQSRDEGGERMPYRARAQRYDFFRRKAVGEA